MQRKKRGAGKRSKKSARTPAPKTRQTPRRLPPAKRAKKTPPKAKAKAPAKKRSKPAPKTRRKTAPAIAKRKAAKASSKTKRVKVSKPVPVPAPKKVRKKVVKRVITRKPTKRPAKRKAAPQRKAAATKKLKKYGVKKTDEFTTREAHYQYRVYSMRRINPDAIGAAISHETAGGQRRLFYGTIAGEDSEGDDVEYSVKFMRANAGNAEPMAAALEQLAAIYDVQLLTEVKLNFTDPRGSYARQKTNVPSKGRGKRGKGSRSRNAKRRPARPRK